MTKAVITFFICLAVYLFVLGVGTLIKFLINKRKIKKQKEEMKEVSENGEESNSSN